jgi:quinol monooxygenase YgiN
MTRFAQHVKVPAAPGKRDELAAKFLETLEFLQSNPDCELTLVSTSPDDPDSVYLTEIWTSKDAHTAATQSDHVRRWAAGMPSLTAGAPDVQPLAPVGWITAGALVLQS